MGTTATAKKLMTAEEFCDWVHQPEQENKWFELVRGEVIELPSPTQPHGFICFNISRIVGNFMYEIGHGYITCNDSGVILERDPQFAAPMWPFMRMRIPSRTFTRSTEKYRRVWPSKSSLPATASAKSCAKSWIICTTASNSFGRSTRIRATSPCIAPARKPMSSRKIRT